MKIWLTYDSAGHLHSRGLEGVFVWFSKPDYHYIKTTRDWEDECLPFGNENGQREGVQRFGWLCDDFSRGEKKFVSFGKVFGYGEGFPMVVWEKLEQHFGSTNLREWSTIAKEKNVTAANFLLEVDLEFTFKIV